MARGLARAKTRVEELHGWRWRSSRPSSALLNTDTAASSVAVGASASLKFKFILKKWVAKGLVATAGTVAAGAALEPEPDEPQGPPPEIDALMRKRETATLQMTEHTKALEQFTGAKRRVGRLSRKGL